MRWSRLTGAGSKNGLAHDGYSLPELLDQIPPGQKIASVTADGAFDTRKCHDAIAARGTAAIIPPRKNAKPWKPDASGAITRNEALRASKRFGWPRRGTDRAQETARRAPTDSKGRRSAAPCQLQTGRIEGWCRKREKIEMPPLSIGQPTNAFDHPKEQRPDALTISAAC